MKAVLFDLDGTLIDTAADFIRIIQQMCRDARRPVVEADLIRTQVSEGACDGEIGLSRARCGQPNILGTSSKLLDLYGNNIVVDTDLFEGMYPLLES